MSSKKTHVGPPRSVIAIAQEEGKLKAVELRGQREIFEVICVKSSKDNDTNWQPFAAGYGVSLDSTVHKSSKSNRIVVLGFNSAGVAFYRINVPSVSREETAAMVRMQAETLLPLPANQMELAWRTGPGRNGQVGVTIAAARRGQVQGFVDNVCNLKPSKILLDCEGIVKAWSTFFDHSEKKAVIVSISAQNTQVCLVENQRLSDAVVIDMGMDDFAAMDEDEQIQVSERFAQDMNSVLDLFGGTKQGDLPVFVLSDGSAAHVSIVSSLRSAGLNARATMPDVNRVKVPSQIGLEGIYEYRVPIGLGLMALEEKQDELNIFKRLYNPDAKEEKKHWLYSPKVACAIAGVMLVLLVIISYAVDVASPGAIEKHLSASDSKADIDSLMQRQRLIRVVAQQRPDVLNLLAQINAGNQRGIKLESFYFKKGTPVMITGQAPNNEQLYRFEKSLQDRTSINDVKMTSSQDVKTKKLRFTMTFHYKNFTR